jgi:hypothetical protein
MPDFKNIYCIIKRSEWDHYQSSSSQRAMFSRVNRISQDKLKSSHENQANFINSLTQLAKKLGFDIDYIPEHEIERRRHIFILCPKIPGLDFAGNEFRL